MDGSVLGTLLAGGLLLFLGSIIAFGGYRLFLILLPIYGFFFGLGFGAHSVQALFGDGFLATTTSWVVGFFAGLLFALLSSLFWAFAVAAIVLNLQKAIVIVSTALIGGWVIVATFLFLFTSATPESLAESGAKMVLDDHPLWFIIFAVVAAIGMIFQFQVNRNYEIEHYNRWEASMGGMQGSPPTPAM